MQPREHQLESIAGHGILKRLVRQLDKRGSMPHAMLFHGPVGIGKKSFAYALAKFINCTSERGSVACDCNACAKIFRGTYLDLTVLKPEGPSGVIKIEKIRALQDSAFITPIEARKKITLFFDAERMSAGAANCILKILEEPPKHLVFILTTSSPHNLLPTIRSRCMPFRFSPLPVKELKRWLVEKHNIEEIDAKIAVLLSEGRPGPALEIAKGDFLERRNNMINELDLFERYGFAALFRVADKIAANSGNLAGALNNLLVWHRDLIVSLLVPDDKSILINCDHAPDIMRKSAHWSVGGLFEAYRSILERQPLANRMINLTLALQVILMDIGTALKKAPL